MYNAIVLRLSHAQMSRTQDVITTSLLVNSFIWKRMRTFSERKLQAMVGYGGCFRHGEWWLKMMYTFKGF